MVENKVVYYLKWYTNSGTFDRETFIAILYKDIDIGFINRDEANPYIFRFIDSVNYSCDKSFNIDDVQVDRIGMVRESLA